MYMKKYKNKKNMVFKDKWKCVYICICLEAATGGVLWKKVFLEISQNPQENTCARVSFLTKFQASGLQLY